MLYSYKECLEKYKNSYQINKVMEAKMIYKIEEGIYSDNEYESEVAVLSKKYPNAIFTGEFAFYVHGFTDLVPEVYSMATKEKAAPIKDIRVNQIYTRNDLIDLGVVKKKYEGTEIFIYDKERMLIELLRNKNKMPKDLYKEIIGNYRKEIDTLEIWRIQEYLDVFPKSKMIKRLFDDEVL